MPALRTQIFHIASGALAIRPRIAGLALTGRPLVVMNPGHRPSSTARRQIVKPNQIEKTLARAIGTPHDFGNRHTGPIEALLPKQTGHPRKIATVSFADVTQSLRTTMIKIALSQHFTPGLDGPIAIGISVRT